MADIQLDDDDDDERDVDSDDAVAVGSAAAALPTPPALRPSMTTATSISLPKTSLGSDGGGGGGGGAMMMPPPPPLPPAVPVADRASVAFVTEVDEMRGLGLAPKHAVAESTVSDFVRP